MTVDKWISEALEKIRTRKSVSELVNGLLETVVRQFDPGPTAPMVHDLVRVLAKHRNEAETVGDRERISVIDSMLSKLDPYIDLAEARKELEALVPGLRPKAVQRDEIPITAGRRKYDLQYQQLAILPPPVRPMKDYDYYAVPIIHCEKPMVYLRDAKVWKCFICGKLIHDT